MHPEHLESTSGPATPRKATAPPYAAAIQFLGQEPDPPKSGSTLPSALARMLDPPQSGSRSSAAIQLLPPSGVTAAIAERCMPLIAERRQINLEGSSSGTAMNGQKSSPHCDRALQKKHDSCSRARHCPETMFVRRAARMWSPRSHAMGH